MGFFDKLRRAPGDAGTSTPDLAVKELLAWVFGSASQQTQSVRRELENQGLRVAENDEDSVLRGIFLLFVAFNFHWVDRAAFQVLRDRRDAFVDLLRDRLVDDLVAAFVESSAPSDTKRMVREGIDRQLDETQAYFAQFDLPSAESNTRGTLLYEFGKALSEELQHPNDIRVMMVGTILATSAIRSFDVRAVLRRI